MKRRIRSLFFTVAIFVPLMSPVSRGGEVKFDQNIVADAYRLGAGDEIQLTVFGHKDLSGNFTVTGAGVVALPLIGNVKAGGLALLEFEQRVVKKLQPDYLKNPRISVEVVAYRPFFIIGEVKRPGSYPFVHGMTVVNAVALAGGYTRRAREDELVIIREHNVSRTIEAAGPQTRVSPGDVIEIPERLF